MYSGAILPSCTDDHVPSGIFGCFAARSRTPGEASGILQHLWLTMRGVNEVRVLRTQVARELVDRFAADDDSGRHVEDGVLRPEFLERAPATLPVVLAEYFLKVPVEQLADFELRLRLSGSSNVSLR